MIGLLEHLNFDAKSLQFQSLSVDFSLLRKIKYKKNVHHIWSSVSYHHLALVLFLFLTQRVQQQPITDGPFLLRFHSDSRPISFLFESVDYFVKIPSRFDKIMFTKISSSTRQRNSQNYNKLIIVYFVKSGRIRSLVSASDQLAKDRGCEAGEYRR